MTVYRVTLAASYLVDTEDWPSIKDESDAIDWAFECLEENLTDGFPLGDMFGYSVVEES